MPVTLAGLAAGGAFMGAKTAYDSYQTEKAMRTQQKYFERNQQKAYENERELMRDSSSLQKSGLMAAGFSPSILAGVSPATPSVPSAPMGEAIANKSTSLGDFASFSMLENQTKVADAQAELLRSQAKGQEIANNRDIHADSQFVNEFKKQLQNQISFYESIHLDTTKLQQEYDNLIENPDFNLGDYVGSMHAIEAHAKSLEMFTKRVHELVEQHVELRRLDNDVSADIAKMPEVARELQEKLVSLKAVETYYLASGSEVNKANLEKIAVEIEHMYSEIDNLVKDGKLKEAEANKIKNNDVATLLGNGEIGKALIASGVRFGEAAAQGAGMAGGYAAIGALSGGTSLGSIANAGKAMRYLRTLPPKNPTRQVQSKLAKKVGSKKADQYFEMWFDAQVKANSAGKPTTDYETWLKEYVKGVKFMRGY